MSHFTNLLLFLFALEARVQFVFCFIRCQSRVSVNTKNNPCPIETRTSSTSLLRVADTPYLRTTYVSDEMVQKFQTLRKAFPTDANVVKAGGWFNLERLSVNPKQDFVGMLADGLKSTEDSKVQFGSTYTAREDEKMEALLLLLYAMGKGFEADLIDGEWDLVFTKQGTKSPAFQKLVGTTEKAGRSKNVFDIASMTFSGDVRFWKWGQLSTKVKYETSSEAYSLSGDGKIVLRRIVCTIIKAFFKWWKLPGLRFPVPRTKGYLDVIYLDQDLRITKGNRGGLFVHMRPRYLEKILSD